MIDTTEDFSEWETLLEESYKNRFSHKLEERDRGHNVVSIYHHQTDPVQDFKPEEEEWKKAIRIEQQEEWKCSLVPFENILEMIGEVQPIRSIKGSDKPRKRAVRKNLKLKNNPVKMEIAGAILGILYSDKRWHQISQKWISKITGYKLTTVNQVFISLVNARIIEKYNNYYNVKDQAITYRLSNQFICEESTLEKERKKNQETTRLLVEMFAKLQKEKEQIEKAIAEEEKKKNRRIGLMKKLKLDPYKYRLCPACDRYKQGFDFNIIKGENILSDSCTNCIKSGIGIRNLKVAI